MDISQDEAKSLFVNGAVLIIAGLPAGTEFGIDLNSYAVDEMFRGIKMIPPGPHYVFTAAQGTFGDYSSRVGFIHYFHAQEIVVREWDADKEELRSRQIANPQDEIRKIKDCLTELDRYLAPYDYTLLSKWKNLTDHITEVTITKCSPECGLIRTSAEFESCPDAERPKGIIENPAVRLSRIVYQSEDDLLPKLKIIQSTAIQFTKIPLKCPRDATPEQITACHMDSIDAIDTLMVDFKSWKNLIDEIQFAFAVFLAGHSIDALDQWRKILILLANSQQSIEKYVEFYVAYLRMLKYQLPELPTELMVATTNNTVYKDLRSLIANCAYGGLKQVSDQLAQHLQSGMNWCFDDVFDEDPDDLPVIVET